MGSRRLALTLLLGVTFLITGCSLQPDISERNLDPSLKQLPALNGPTVGGGSYTLAQRGHPAVVDFWASWCGPCREQQPELNALARCYGPYGVIFIGVDIRDDRANASAYAREFGVGYPSIFDPSSDLAGQFDVAAPPTTLVADGRGRVVPPESGFVRPSGGHGRGQKTPELAAIPSP